MSEACRLCKGEPYDDITEDASIPLCNSHWAWWVMRFALGQELPPSNAHLLEGNSNPEVTGD